MLVHRGGRGQSFVYELLYEGQGKDGRASSPASSASRSCERTTAAVGGKTRSSRAPVGPGRRVVGALGGPKRDRSRPLLKLLFFL